MCVDVQECGKQYANWNDTKSGSSNWTGSAVSSSCIMLWLSIARKWWSSYTHFKQRMALVLFVPFCIAGM